MKKAINTSIIDTVNSTTATNTKPGINKYLGLSLEWECKNYCYVFYGRYYAYEIKHRPTCISLLVTFSEFENLWYARVIDTDMRGYGEVSGKTSKATIRKAFTKFASLVTK